MTYLRDLYENKKSIENNLVRRKNRSMKTLALGIGSAFCTFGLYMISDSDSVLGEYTVRFFPTVFSALTVYGFGSSIFNWFMSRNLSNYLESVNQSLSGARDDLLEDVRKGKLGHNIVDLDNEVLTGKIDRNEAENALSQGLYKKRGRELEDLAEQGTSQKETWSVTEWDPNDDSGYDPKYRDSVR